MENRKNYKDSEDYKTKYNALIESMKAQGNINEQGKYFPATKGVSTQDKKLDQLTKDIRALKQTLFSGADPTFTEARRKIKEDPEKQKQIDQYLEQHFSKSGLKLLKTLVLNKLLTGVFTHQQYAEYTLASVQEKKEMLMTLLVDNPFLAGLIAKAAPWVVNKAYEYLKPKVMNIGRTLANKGIEKLKTTPLGRTLVDSQIGQDTRKAFNLDPEETENPLPNLDPSTFNGPTSGLLVAPLSRRVTSSDVCIKSMQSAFWPENEAYRVALPSENAYTAVLQATSYITVPASNATGNLFMVIAPPLIDNGIFATVYNAAGATITSLGAGTNYAGPLNSTLANFADLRVTGMSVNIMNLIAPLNRSGTISVAITNRYRNSGTAPTFSDMSMAMAFYQSSYHADNYSALYVPDEHNEWDLRAAGSLTATSSDILIAIEGTQASVVPMKVLISYTLEFTPSIASRPLVNIGRANVAPATLSAIQLMLKHYNSVLIASPNTRGDFFRALSNKYGEYMKIDQLSEELATNFEPIRTSSYANTSQTIAPSLNNVMSSGGPRMVTRSEVPQSVFARRVKKEIREQVERSVSPVQDNSVDDGVLKAVKLDPTASLSNIIRQWVSQASNIGLTVTEDSSTIIITDHVRNFKCNFGKWKPLLVPLEYPLVLTSWPGQLLDQIKDWIDLPSVLLGHQDITDNNTYSITLGAESSDDISIIAFIEVSKGARSDRSLPLAKLR